MLHIPKNASTSAVTSFWIVLFGLGSLIMIIVYTQFMSSHYFILACFAAIVIFMIIFYLKPFIFQTVYKYYIGFIQRILVPLINNWVLGIIFYIILFVNRVYGKNLELTENNASGSMWYPKSINNLLGGSGRRDVVIDDTVQKSKFIRLYKWFMRSDQWWLITLIPFLLILSLTYDGKAESSLSGDTYTLY